MADEPINPAPEAPPTAAEATAPPEPTPTQVDSQQFTATLDAEIDALWAEAEGRAPRTLLGEEASPPPAPEAAPTDQAGTEPPKAEAPKDETPPPVETPDAAEIERRVRAKLDAEAAATKATEDRLRADQQQREAAAAYVGSDTDYATVNAALRSHLAGDSSALDALDVVLPNGKRVSEVKGEKGLTEGDAANLLTAWDTARRFEDVIGDRKVQRLIDVWNNAITSSQVLDHPDVDMAAVIRHQQPHDQMRALRDSVAERVTKRLTDAHAEVVKSKDAEIAKLTERVTSLQNERGNLTAQQAAAAAGSLDRPGQPGALRPSIPTPEELAAMDADEAFRSGAIDRVLQSLPGGLSGPRRRTG